jgi:hypothetical protein
VIIDVAMAGKSAGLKIAPCADLAYIAGKSKE